MSTIRVSFNCQTETGTRDISCTITDYPLPRIGETLIFLKGIPAQIVVDVIHFVLEEEVRIISKIKAK